MSFRRLNPMMSYISIVYASTFVGAIAGIMQPTSFLGKHDDILRPAVCGGCAGFFIGILSPVIVPTLVITSPLVAYRSICDNHMEMKRLPRPR